MNLILDYEPPYPSGYNKKYSNSKVPNKSPKCFDTPLQLSICDVVAPLAEEYPSSLDPDQALDDEDDLRSNDIE